ncbi:ABC transporter ATP-binding protein [bacterium]|nr:ABC transporter ATP-binding protein [bacterium]
MKEILSNLGYNLKEYSKEYRTRPLYRDSDNENVLVIYKDSGRWVDFKENITGNLQDLVRITLNLQDNTEAKEWITQKVPSTETYSVYKKPQIKQVKCYSSDVLTKLVKDHSFWNKRNISDETMNLFEGGILKEGRMKGRYVFPIFDKVEDIILNQGGYYGFTHRELKNHCQYLLERLDLWKQRHDQARTLSGGMKRRLMVARALIHQPQILILDEPTAGVDVELRRGMWEFLKEINQQGITIILTSHYLEEVELLCQRIGMIDGGRLIKQHSVRDFIELAEQQVFIIELAEPFDNHINLTDLNVISIDSQTLSFTKKQGQTLESFFVALYEAGAKISSVKPENNRLESLFIAITNKGAKNV